MQADLVLTGGVVYTVDARRSRHEAVAVKDGRIVALGSAAEAAEWAGPRTRTVDLGGRLVLPGFADAHLHPSFATGELFEVRLADCRSVEECLDRVARFAAEHPELPAIRGGGWFPTMVPMEGMTAEALDRVVPDRPACLHDDNVHAQWVNSELLRRAGVGREDPGWTGAVVERLPDGSPKGLLHEAFPWVDRALPQYTVGQRGEALRYFQRELAARYGTTLVHEAGLHPWETMLDAYLRLEAADELTARFCLDVMLDPDLPLDGQLEAAAKMRARFDGPAGPRRRRQVLRRRGDRDAHGVPGRAVRRPPGLSRRAHLGAGAPRRGVASPRPRRASSCTTTPSATRRVSLAVDAIAAGGAGERGPEPGARGRDIITHVQLLDPADYARMAAARRHRGRAAVLVHQGPGLRPALRRLVGERADRQFPMRSFAARRRPGRGASDYPVSPPPDPLLAIQRGVLRRDPRPAVENAELWPEEAVDVETMIAAFTLAGARANFLEHETGSLEVGKSADLVVLRGEPAGDAGGADPRGRGAADAVPRPAGVRRRPLAGLEG